MQFIDIQTFTAGGWRGGVVINQITHNSMSNPTSLQKYQYRIENNEIQLLCTAKKSSNPLWGNMGQPILSLICISKGLHATSILLCKVTHYICIFVFLCQRGVLSLDWTTIVQAGKEISQIHGGRMAGDKDRPNNSCHYLIQQMGQNCSQDFKYLN